MNTSVIEIPFHSLLLVFVPVAIVVAIMAAWRAGPGTAIYASARMLVQLMLIGYVLIFVFRSDNWMIIGAVLGAMLLVASWIATRTLAHRSLQAYLQALLAIGVGGIGTLVLVTQAVIGVEPWFSPRYVVPLAGMTLSGAMTAVTLAAERFDAEVKRGENYDDARRVAFKAALIPITNALFAVGLVALPGMMTGQILSGVSPIIAAQYQIVVMAMLFGAEGIAAAIYLAMRR